MIEENSYFSDKLIACMIEKTLGQNLLNQKKKKKYCT